MGFQAPLTSFILVSCFWISLGQYISNEFQFETIKRPGAAGEESWRWRSEAAEFKTLRLENKGRKVVTLTLCAVPEKRGPVMAYVDNIRYANDGGADQVVVSVNGRPIASFDTAPMYNWGHNWNVFHDTGKIGRNFNMRKGNYRLAVKATTDEWGIELDKIDIKSRNQKPGHELICKAAMKTG